jgi:hypothetical protein
VLSSTAATLDLVAPYLRSSGRTWAHQRFLDRQAGLQDASKAAKTFFQRAKGPDFMSWLQGYATLDMVDVDPKRQLKLHVGWAKFETILKATPDVPGERPNDSILRLRIAEIAWHKYKARSGVEINEKAASFG